MKIAVLHDDGNVYVEFPPDVFRQLLKSYLKKYNNVDSALDKIIADLKKEVGKK